MGKKMHHKDPPGMQLQNGNSGGVNKIFHALNRRHKWQNGQKALPDKRKGSGKHIVDVETTEPVASTSQPPQVQGNQKKNKPQVEQPEAGPVTTSKATKKFRIRALIADEMTKRRSKGQPRRRSPSPTRSPRNHSKTPTKNSCESPSTMKKRKCNICAAMLTVSYLRQKAQAYEEQKNVEENRAKKQQQASLTKSFSFPLIGSPKRKDKEVEELKRKLRECKDKETTKEKFILPMNHWKEALLPKPMLTRPASFRSPSFRIQTSTSQKENNQNNSKTLRQKIGKVMKENKEGRESRENRKKEKRRILMDAVFHKIPYGRRNSKDPKKLSPDKMKSNSTTASTGSHRMAADQATLKKTASTGEAMTKYRKLLSQTSIREEKCHHNDYKPKLCVAGDQSTATNNNERKTLKSIHSLPVISPSDFTQNQEFPVKSQMDTHQSIATAILDDHKSLDPVTISAKVSVPTPAIQSLVKDTKLVGKSPGVDVSTSDYQEKNEPQNESSATIETETKKTKLHEEDEDKAVDVNPGLGLSTSDSSAAIESEVKETKLVDKYEHVDENLEVSVSTSDIHEKIDRQKEDSAVDRDEGFDENLGVSLITSDHREDTANESETNETNSVEKDEAIKIDATLNSSDHEEKTEKVEETSDAKVSPEIEVNDDKYFNDILEKFKKVERIKLDEGIEPIAPVRTEVIKGSTDDKYPSVDENLQVDEITLDHQEKESSPLTLAVEVEGSMQDPILESTSLIDIPQSDLLEGTGTSDGNQQYLLSIDDQPSTPDIDDKRPTNVHPVGMSAATKVKGQMPKNAFLHLDLKSVKDNTDFQFVKEVLERSGFLENEILGEWYSKYQPIDPLLFEEVEATFLQTKNLEELDSMKDEEAAPKIINDHHLLLFDLINEALLEIHKKTCTYCPNPLIYGSKVRPMPVGYRVLEDVWDHVNMYLSWRRDYQPSLDDSVLRLDLEKGDGWMNLQADAEFVGIELEEMLTDDLLDELVFDDLLM